MRNASIATEVRMRLLRAGFSRSYANRTAAELQEHWNEIVEEGLRSGLLEIEAQREAAQRLGSAEDLVKDFSARLEKSSWLGRHPSLGFGLLALTLTLLWWIAFGSVAAEICGLFSWDPKNAQSIPPKMETLETWFDWIRATSYLAVPGICCYIAERYFCGWRPALWACLVVAIHNATHFMRITGAPGNGSVAWGYGFSFASMPSLLAILAPLAVFGLYRAWNLCSGNPETPNPTFCLI